MHRQNNAVAIVFAATSCVHFTNSMMEYREKKEKEKTEKTEKKHYWEGEFGTMIGKNRLLVAGDPVEIEI